MAIQVELTDTFEQWRVKTNQISVTADGFESNILALQSNVTTLRGNVTTLTGNVSTLTGNIATLTPIVTGLTNNVNLLRVAVVQTASNVELGNVAGKRLFINGLNGFVGINNTNPGANLDVAGTIRVTPDTNGTLQIGRFSSVYGGGALDFRGSATFGSFQFEGTERARLTSTGRLGIGTQVPRGNLHVTGNLTLGNNAGYVTLVAPAAASQTYTLPSADGTTGQVLSTNGSGALSWATAASGGETTGAQTIVQIIAGETLSTGNIVNIYDSGGNFRVRKASATNRYESHGFVVQGVSSGNTANVYLSGLNANVAGLSPGAVYLSTTSGSITQTAPTGTNQLVQRIGTATSATSFIFDPQTPILLS